MIITLDEAKLYLKVDGAEEDTLISNLIHTAEELCEGILRYPLTEFTVVPDLVKHTVIYAVASMYEQRETTDSKAMLDVMTRLLFPFRKEGW